MSVSANQHTNVIIKITQLFKWWQILIPNKNNAPNRTKWKSTGMAEILVHKQISPHRGCSSELCRCLPCEVQHRCCWGVEGLELSSTSLLRFLNLCSDATAIEIQGSNSIHDLIQYSFPFTRCILCLSIRCSIPNGRVLKRSLNLRMSSASISSLACLIWRLNFGH